MKKKMLIMAAIAVLLMGFTKIDSQAGFTECYGEHSWYEWEVDKKATATTYGRKSRMCEDCLLEQIKTIPKTTITANEKKAVSTVENFFKYGKSYNGKKLNSCFAQKPKNIFFTTNKYMPKFCKKYNREALSYAITKVSVKGKKATVKAMVIYPDAWDAFYNAFDDTVLYLIKHPKAKSKTIQKYIYDSALFYDDKITDMSKNITFTLKKTKNGWKINKATKKMGDLVNCGYETAHSMYFD